MWLQPLSCSQYQHFWSIYLRKNGYRHPEYWSSSIIYMAQMSGKSSTLNSFVLAFYHCIDKLAKLVLCNPQSTYNDSYDPVPILSPFLQQLEQAWSIGNCDCEAFYLEFFTCRSVQTHSRLSGQSLPCLSLWPQVSSHLTFQLVHLCWNLCSSIYQPWPCFFGQVAAFCEADLADARACAPFVLSSMKHDFQFVKLLANS